MNTRQIGLVLVAGASLMLAGCGPRYYPPPPPPPPPPYTAVPPLVQQAEQSGFRAGVDDGARDAMNGYGYHPQGDRNYAITPGYDPHLGPLGPYRKYFRNAYRRGYYKGFYHQEPR